MPVATSFTADKLETAAFILKTIAHPTRIAIIDLLKGGDELSVNEICHALEDVEQSLVSHHLANMKHKGVLNSRREGRKIYYFLKLQEVIAVLECMENCELR